MTSTWGGASTHSRLGRLFSTAAVGTVMALSAFASAQAADAAAKSDAATEINEVVVTGTSIRGQAPVGNSVTVVSAESIQKTSAQTIQDVLKSVPAVVGLGSAGQGSFGSADGAGTNAPTIHGLGASASNSTLILIDGHRFSLSGLNHTLADPNIVPPMALERVEVLADGASSIYGSDAVAGVVNFITRKHYNGFEAKAQRGFGDSYDRTSIGFVGGKTWDTGSALIAYDYSFKSALQGKDRPFTGANHLAQGGSNLSSFNCNQATIQPGGAGNIYAAPYTTGVANAPVNAMCDYTGLTDLLPREQRNSIMVKLEQEVGDRLTANADIVYSDRQNMQRTARGSVTATIFGPGNTLHPNQINPFFTGVPGSTANVETVRWNADGLLGPGAHIDTGERSIFANAAVEYKISDNWRANAQYVMGDNTSRQLIIGQICGSCAYLALNGTTNGSGSLTAVSIPGTSIIALNSPLTAANALDVFNVTGNRTSAAVLASLTDSTQSYIAHHTIRDAKFSVSGTLFALPAGDVKLAVGGESIHYSLSQDITRPLGIGPSSLGSSATNLSYKRDVKSAYAELLIPVVSPEQNIPFVRRIDLNISDRYDDYSDFGNTTNPKFGLNWEVVEGVKLRSSYADSFVAPALTSFGSTKGNGITGESGFANYGLGAVNVPVAQFPGIVGLPGCAVGAVTCQIGNSVVTGAQINGGSSSLQPQKGKSWSFGADYRSTFLPGLNLSATFWHNEIEGGITAPVPALAVNSPALASRLKFFPAGATPAQIAALQLNLPTTSTLPANIYFVYNYQQGNVLNLWVEGVDVSASYNFDTDFGSFDLGTAVAYETKFDQQIGAGTGIFSVLNTTGYNTTFPSIKLNARTSLGWKKGPVSATAYWNYTGSYKNWGGSAVNPLVKNAQGIPTGAGGDNVDALNTFDAHVAYSFDGEGITSGMQIFADATNLLDKKPSFYNNAQGYDTYSGNPIGRIVSIGVRKKW